MLRFASNLAICGAGGAGMIGLAGASWAQTEVKSATLDAVKKRDQVICGIDTGIPGYAYHVSVFLVLREV